MDFLEILDSRNAEFAQSGFSANLEMLPSRRTMIIGCVDPRVDPMNVLKLEPGEAIVIRNVGGRVNPALLETMAILGAVSQSLGGAVEDGWNLVVLQHTDCGIKRCYHHAPKLLAKHMGVSEDKLDDLAVTDPYKAVAVDVALLKANPNLPGGFMVTGLVYDVKTGRVATVVPAAKLRSDLN